MAVAAADRHAVAVDSNRHALAAADALTEVFSGPLGLTVADLDGSTHQLCAGHSDGPEGVQGQQATRGRVTAQLRTATALTVLFHQPPSLLQKRVRGSELLHLHRTSLFQPYTPLLHTGGSREC